MNPSPTHHKAASLNIYLKEIIFDKGTRAYFRTFLHILWKYLVHVNPNSSYNILELNFSTSTNLLKS